MFKISDELYGECYVDDVIYEIINTKIFKRLKNIYQSGGGYLVNDLWNVNRQEHSIGTMILSLKFGGNIEEQIRALLHDISHTAFSHVIDYILKNENEDYHEKIQKNFLNDEELVSILRKYNLNIKRIILTIKFNKRKAIGIVRHFCRTMLIKSGAKIIQRLIVMV